MLQVKSQCQASKVTEVHNPSIGGIVYVLDLRPVDLGDALIIVNSFTWLAALSLSP